MDKLFVEDEGLLCLSEVKESWSLPDPGGSSRIFFIDLDEVDAMCCFVPRDLHLVLTCLNQGGNA